MRISDWISDVCSSDLRIDAAPDAPRLLGYGEASDAHHMSTPHPQGLGAELALNDALARAGLDPAQVGYINLHGTASQKNDEVEAALVARAFPATTRASPTKGFTGHTLGAAGVVEEIGRAACRGSVCQYV